MAVKEESNAVRQTLVLDRDVRRALKERAAREETTVTALHHRLLCEGLGLPKLATRVPKTTPQRSN